MLYSDNTSIVLGADGFLGRHLVRVLTSLGENVHSIGRKQGDMSKLGVADHAMAAAPRAARIFHMITRQRTGPVQYDIQGELLAVNASIHLNILNAWRDHQPQAKLIVATSSCMYPEMDEPISEAKFLSGPVHQTVRGYAQAKQLLAVGCQSYAEQYGFRYLMCVLATVFGPGDHKQPDRSHFMTGMIDRAVGEKQERRESFSVWGSPSTERDLLYVDDQIDAMLVADKAFENDLVNCTSGSPITIGAAAQGILEALEWSVPVVYPQGTFQGAARKILDSGRFLSATSWKPRVDLVQGIRRVLQADYSNSPAIIRG